LRIGGGRYCEESMIEIIDLKACPHVIPTVAQWCVDEWKYWPLEIEIERLEECLTDSDIPLTFVALEGNTPVGTIGIILHDMETRMDLTPWLASLYVLPSHRNRGLGRCLVRELVLSQDKLGISPLYLFTSTQQSLYGEFGFKPKEVVDYRGEQVTIMERCLLKEARQNLPVARKVRFG
jgi:predicted N-acetyltransferase YhbS